MTKVLLRRYRGRLLLLVPSEPGSWEDEDESQECLAFLGMQKKSMVPEEVMLRSEPVEGAEIFSALQHYAQVGLGDLAVVERIPIESERLRAEARQRAQQKEAS